MAHVDAFIDDNFTKRKYARWVLSLYRCPAVLSADFAEWMRPFKNRLFCTYNGKRYKITGCRFSNKEGETR